MSATAEPVTTRPHAPRNNPCKAERDHVRDRAVEHRVHPDRSAARRPAHEQGMARAVLAQPGRDGRRLRPALPAAGPRSSTGWHPHRHRPPHSAVPDPARAGDRRRRGRIRLRRRSRQGRHGHPSASYAMEPGSPLSRETLGRLRDTGLEVRDIEFLPLGPDTGPATTGGRPWRRVRSWARARSASSGSTTTADGSPTRSRSSPRTPRPTASARRWSRSVISRSAGSPRPPGSPAPPARLCCSTPCTSSAAGAGWTRSVRWSRTSCRSSSSATGLWCCPTCSTCRPGYPRRGRPATSSRGSSGRWSARGSSRSPTCLLRCPRAPRSASRSRTPPWPPACPRRRALRTTCAPSARC